MIDLRNATDHEIEMWVYAQDEIDRQEKAKALKELKKVRRVVDKKLREKILVRDNYTCKICGKDGSYYPDGMEIDHIKPVSKGGTSEETNLQTLCHNCNSRKSNR